jgi:GGDEF domain-containing protein
MLAFLLAPRLPTEYLVLQSIVLLASAALPVERVSPVTLLIGVFVVNLAAYVGMRWLGAPEAVAPAYLMQLAVLSATALLVRLVRATISELDSGLWRFVLDGGLSRVRPWEEVQPEAMRELHRSRRYARPLSLVMLDIESPSDTNDKAIIPASSRVFGGYEAAVTVAQLAAEQIRSLDLVCWSYKPRRLLLVLTEANNDNARQFVARFSALVAEQTGLGLRTGIASFPEHALTMEDLYQRAEAALEQRLADDYRLPVLTPRERGS